MKAVMGCPEMSGGAAASVATGAEALVRTLVACGVDTCFTNPGTSEMHFVAALDRVDGMRCVLALFEGVATGAADGYARMTGRPASTLLHLGPGLANGLANLHNAHRALSPVVNIVGEHATYHRQYDPPLHSNIAALAGVYSSWVTSVNSPDGTAVAAAEAVAAALVPPGRISTLILPADTAWSESTQGPASRPCRFLQGPRRRPARASCRRQPAQRQSGADSERTAAPHGPARHVRPNRGRDRSGAARADAGAAARAGSRPCFRRPDSLRHRIGVEAAAAPRSSVVLVNARPPVAFFAYPNKPSLLLPPDCEVLTLADPAEDGVDAIERLADTLGARGHEPVREPFNPPPLAERTDHAAGAGGRHRRAAARAGDRRR